MKKQKISNLRTTNNSDDEFRRLINIKLREGSLLLRYSYFTNNLNLKK
jgi:hypothetical protein